MIVLQFTYQNSQNLAEVNRQVYTLTEEIKHKFMECASSESADSLSLQIKQASEGLGERVAKINMDVNENTSLLSMLASYNSATAQIDVAAGLIDGLERSSITLTGDQITLNGNTTIGSGFKLTATNIDATNLHVNAALIDGTLAAEKIAARSISADKIAAGTITATEMAGNTITAAEIKGGTITGDKIAAGTITADNIAAGAITADKIEGLELDGDIIKANNFVASNLSVNRLNCSDEIETPYLLVSGNAAIRTIPNDITVNGDLEANRLRSTSPDTSSAAANVRFGETGRLRLIQSGSSKRFKNDISTNLSEDMDPHKLYDLNVVRFKYNTDYLTNEEDKRYDTPLIGLIAEDMDKIYPQACDYEDDGSPIGWNAHYLIPPMLYLIQELKKEIDELKERT